MAFPNPPKTWAFQEGVESSEMNAQVRDALLLVPHRIPKEADQSVVSSTAFVNDTHLQFAIGANEAWEFQLVLGWTGPGLFKAALNAPSGASGFWSTDIVIGGSVARGVFISATFIDSETVSGNISPDVQTMGGYCLNGGTAGTFTLRWAQLSSNATATTLKKGSWLERRKV